MVSLSKLPNAINQPEFICYFSVLNESVESFANITNSKRLKYSCRDMSDVSLLTKVLPELREQHLTHCPDVTFKRISTLTRNCP